MPVIDNNDYPSESAFLLTACLFACCRLLQRIRRYPCSRANSTNSMGVAQGLIFTFPDWFAVVLLPILWLVMWCLGEQKKERGNCALNEEEGGMGGSGAKAKRKGGQHKKKIQQRRNASSSESNRRCVSCMMCYVMCYTVLQ